MSLSPQIFQFAELFDHVEEVLAWVKDAQHRFVWTTRASVLMQAERAGDGATVPEILGKTDHDFSPAVLADQYRLDDEYVLAGNRIVNRIEPFRSADGTMRWHVTNKIPLFDERGDVIGTAGIARRVESSARDVLPGSAFGPVLACIRDHYRSAITNRKLAALAHMSVRTFERKFQSSFHLSPQKYLRRFRLRIASHALVFTDRPLSEIALSCGFADQSHFTREFRRQYGKTPRAHRAHYAVDGERRDAASTVSDAFKQ